MVQPYSDVSQSADPEPLGWEDSQVFLREHLDEILESCTLSFSSVLPQKDLHSLLRVTVHWGKESNQTFQGLSGTGSRRPHEALWSYSSRAYGFQVIMEFG